MRRATWLALIALLATALAGFAIGFMAGRNAPRRLDKMTLLGVSRSLLLDSLNLTAQQRQRIDSVLTESEQRAARAIETMFTDVRSTTRQTRERVRAALDADQRVKLDSMLSKVTELRPRSPLPPRDTAP